MCVSVVGRVVALSAPIATVELSGAVRRCNSLPVADLRVGDPVLVHAGLVLRVLSAQEAREIEELLAGLSGAAPHA